MATSEMSVTNATSELQDALYNVPDEVKKAFDFNFLSDIEWSGMPYFATGGMAEVYLGGIMQGNTVAVVAIKTMHGAHCSENRQKLIKFLRRLKREEKNLGQAKHPNVVEFFGISPWNLITPAPTPGLVSAYCEEGTVIDYLRKYGSTMLPVHRVKIITEIAKGLEYLHSEDINSHPAKHCMIHGDIKPNNVLIKKDGTAAICDFGQARLLGIGNESGLTTGLNMTPRYLAPEVFEALENGSEEVSDDDGEDNEKLDRSGRLTSKEGDVYSFALTSLEIATDVPPFRNIRPYRIASIVKAGKSVLKKSDFEKISEIDGLWEILERCWSKVPESRPQMPVVVGELDKVQL